jgi:hypothetical protein
MVSLIEATDAINLESDLPPLDSENPVHIGPVSLQIVSFWYRSDVEKPETGKGRSILVGPDGQELGKHEVEIDLESIVSRNVIAILPSLPYKGLGYYHFLVEKMDKGEDKWIRTARLPLLLRASPKTD